MSGKLRVIAGKVVNLFRPARADAEFEDEMEAHLRLLAERFIEQGMSGKDAREAAQRQFGNTTLLHEGRREMRTFFSLATIWGDLRFAARQLRRDRILTATAICSLALGIGANTAIFTVAKKVLFDTLPVKNPQELRMLTWVSGYGHERPVPPVWGDIYASKEGGLQSTSFSYPVVEELRKRTEVFDALIAFKDISLTATVDGHSELIEAEMVSGGALGALGVEPIVGRGLLAADDMGPGTAPVAVISEGYWAERFGRSTSAIGKTIALSGMPVTVVGVAPARFTGLTMGSTARIFVPLTMQPLVAPRAQVIGSGGESLLNNPQSWWVLMVARLRPTVSEAQTQAALDVVLRQTATATLGQSKALDTLHLKLERGDRGQDGLGGFAEPSYVLLGLAGLVLLLACVNLANLLLARATSRQREMGTRLALGAGRVRILRQVLTESLLLSGLGGIAGGVLGYFGRNAIPRLLAEPWRPGRMEVDFDWRVLAFTAGVSLMTGLLFGIVPAWQAIRADMSTALKDGSHATASRQRAWLGKGLVMSQIALSAILLIGAGLFLRTLANLRDRPLGFQADHLLLFQVNPPRTRYTDGQMVALYRQLEEKCVVIPGVRSVTLSNIALVGDGHSGSTFHPTGRPAVENEERVQTNAVGADFFRTMGIPILEGRGFNVHDTANSQTVAVINRAMARKYFPNESPIGQTFESEDLDQPAQIVGLVENTRWADLREESPPMFYLAYPQRPMAGRVVFEIRTAADPFSVLSQVRGTMETLDRELPLIDVRTQTEQVEASLSRERIFAQLTSGFGVLALVLASIGIYGIMAYTVARRTSEIGVRMALGAQGQQVLGMVLRESLWMATAGVAVGIGGALWLGRFVGTLLYGLKAADPLTLATATGLLILVAVVAGVGPARRAARIDPIHALRHE